MTNNIKHVFFDLDHTLWDFDKNSGLTFEKIFKLNCLDIRLDEFLEVYEPINFKYWKLYREERVSKSALRYGRLKDAFDAINVSVEDEMIDHLSVAYIDHLTTFNHLFEGTTDILEYLKGKYNLHIITNGFDKVQKVKLAKSGISNYFATVTTSESVNVKKPNPKIFEYALQSAKANADESIMIGDCLEADVIGAFNMGIKPIYFNEKGDKETNFISVKSLTDIKQYL